MSNAANDVERFIKEEFKKTSVMNRYLVTMLFKDSQFLDYAKRVTQGRTFDEANANVVSLISSEIDLDFIAELILAHLKYRMGVDIDDSITIIEEVVSEDSDN